MWTELLAKIIDLNLIVTFLIYLTILRSFKVSSREFWSLSDPSLSAGFQLYTMNMLFESSITFKHEYSCKTTGIANKIHIGLVLGRRGTLYGEIRKWIEVKWKRYIHVLSRSWKWISRCRLFTVVSKEYLKFWDIILFCIGWYERIVQAVSQI